MNIAQHILIGILRLYKAVLSPLQTALFGPDAGCRFTPTCSCYSMEAVQRHGALKGLVLTVKRLGRCHPWGGCGDDPVPMTVHFFDFRHPMRTPCNIQFFKTPRC